VAGQLVDDLVPALGPGAAAGAALGASGHRVREVRREADPDQYDRGVVAAEGFREADGVADHLGPAERGDRGADDAVLQVDQDERGARVQGGQCHGGASRQMQKVRKGRTARACGVMAG
jgi:hypothetical protein